MPHRFAVGQAVAYFPTMSEWANSAGRYTVVRLLPEDANGCHYHIQHSGGELRRVRETQLRPLSSHSVAPTQPRHHPVKSGAVRTALIAVDLGHTNESGRSRMPPGRTRAATGKDEDPTKPDATSQQPPT